MGAPFDKKLMGTSFIAILGILVGAAALVQVQTLGSQISELTAQHATHEGLLKGLTKPPAQKTQKFEIIIGEFKLVTEENGKEVLGVEGYRFEPMVLVVHKGDKVAVTIKNLDEMVHSFLLPVFRIDTGKLAPLSGSATFEFVADKAGIFQFRCGVPFNQNSNECDLDHPYMVGWLIVLE